MPRKQRVLECPQCGEKIRGRSVYSCSGCGHVLDLARISYQGAIRHDRHDERLRRMEWVYLGLWLAGSAGLLLLVSLRPGPMVCGLAAVTAAVQIALGRLLVMRRRRR